MPTFPEFKAHPWHGVPTGTDAPRTVNAYIEIVPSDSIKYEIDKESGHLLVDRPQKYSSQCPALYGFIPRTYCGTRIAARCSARLNRPNMTGDGDPLDILVLSDRVITRGDILVRARPIGGFRMIDANEADDKIIAVLIDDTSCGGWSDISDCPSGLIDRLRHYFLTYKELPGATPRVQIAEQYDAAEAQHVIESAIADYHDLRAVAAKP